MALITCSECGGQVSSTAAACPHCGAPVSAAPAAEERKCGECGAVLPAGAAACPNCGCPAEIKSAQPVQPVQPAQAAQTAYIAPTAAPARVQLGSAKARITEEVNRKTANANVWLLIASLATIGAYLYAFAKYMKFFDGINKYKDIALAAAVAADKIFKTNTYEDLNNFLDLCKGMQILTIAALIIAGLALIFDLIRISKKKLMENWELWILVVEIAGFWIPIGTMSNVSGLDNTQLKELLDFITDNKFGTYITIASIAIFIMYIISLVAKKSVPKESDYCSSCGRYIKKEGAGGVCKGCGKRKYIPGFTPIPRDVVAAYPYSGETLVGMSPVRKTHICGVLTLVILFGGTLTGCLVGAIILKEPSFIGTCLAALIATIIYTVFSFKAGIRDKITVTPTEVKLRHINNHGRFNVPISKITDVLTNESGDLALCAGGMAFIFTDISCRAQIAAALDMLTSKNQMN